MKLFRFTLFALAVFLGFDAFEGDGQSASIINALITVTNSAGTTNGQTIVVNGNTRTWTNNVVVPSSQILTNSTANGAATNLFSQFSQNPFLGVSMLYANTNAITLQAAPNVNLTVTLSAGWGTVVYTTNTLATTYALRLPVTAETANPRTNIVSMLALAIDDSSSTNVVHENAPMMQQFLGKTNVQTVTGAKTFSSISGTVGGFTNGAWLNPKTTNLVNYGNALSSPSAYSGAEQFGDGAQAIADQTLALGNGSTAVYANGIAVGWNALSQGNGCIAIGSGVSVYGVNSIGIGGTATKDGSIAIGSGSSSTYTNSAAIGYNSASTAANQVMLGSATVSTVVNSSLSVGAGATITGGITNLIARGTNTIPAGGDIAFGRYALSSLATGNNAAIPVGTNVFVEVSGPGAAFTINGIAGGRDGKLLIILNQTGFNMTIAHDSGVDATAANRIYTMTGADRATTGNGAAMLIYSGAASRWILFSLDQ
jgi:hypothetical protein